MKQNISYVQSQQKKITQLVTAKFKKYYLTGGTALAFYFRHRFSEDLDFFTQDYKKDYPEKIMRFISEKTKFKFKLEAEQDDPKLIPMKVYSLDLKKGLILKIDFVQDFEKNLKKIKKGLHSIEDIYARKIFATIGKIKKQDASGKIIPAGRQSTKDLFDLYTLSNHHQPLSEFFFEHFSYDKAEALFAWYRRFNRMALKVELLELVQNVDTHAVIRYLDDEILNKIPEKLTGDKN